MGGTLKLAGALGLLLIAGAFLLAAPAEGAGVLLHEAPSQRCPTALSRRSGVPVQLMLRGGDDEDEDGDEEGEGGGDGEEEKTYHSSMISYACSTSIKKKNTDR